MDSLSVLPLQAISHRWDLTSTRVTAVLEAGRSHLSLRINLGYPIYAEGADLLSSRELGRVKAERPGDLQEHT